MTKQQQLFFNMLNNYRFNKFWSPETMSLDISGLQQELNYLSNGERHMAKFFASLWLGNSPFSFDLIDALKHIDYKSHNIILKWLAAPFYP